MAPLLYASYALLAGMQLATLFVTIPMSVQMMLAAPLTVYLGSMLSLSQEVAEQIEHSDALSFPVFAGATLAALFVAFKYINPALINTVLTVYFCAVGSVTVGQLLEPLLRPFIPANQRARKIIDVPLPYMERLVCTTSDVVCFIPGAIAAVWYGVTRHYLGNNLLGISFCVEGLKRMALGNYATGATLLALLFVYDIGMVFYTPLMVTVATKLEGPIKLLFPRGTGPDPITGKLSHSLLGLGEWRERRGPPHWGAWV